MKHVALLVLTWIFLGTINLSAQVDYVYPQNESFTYEQAISAFDYLVKEYPEVEMVEYGKTDVGRPLHLAIFNANQEFDPQQIDRKEQSVILINNAIHPGESCGVDATVRLFEYLATHRKLFPNVVVIAIPVYNVGGMLNRSPYNRSGQPGPTECGFRGNYQNLDLNRDFVKCDSRNAREFSRIYHDWNPDLFFDTHTTNGSDHQYTLTLILSQKEKMNPVLAEYVYGKMEPLIYRKMEEKGYEVVPYVYGRGKTPEEGIMDFMETPRYSSGYVNLFNTIGIITEAHKYKTFTQRVEHTYQFLKFMTEYASRNHTELSRVRELANEYSVGQQIYDLNWELDTNQWDSLPFKGYGHEQAVSAVTGQAKLAYQRDEPKTFNIPYFRTYKATDSVSLPDYYILPQCYEDVVDRLQLNRVEMQALTEDTLIPGEVYYIEKVKSLNHAYENHFAHTDLKIRRDTQRVQFYSGDWIIPTQQKNVRYLVEVLEPRGADSFFRWNFFDNILMQKEWFSAFAFDDVAQELLDTDPDLKREFDAKRNSDAEFAGNHRAQLAWIFYQSPYYEKTHKRYPVLRVYNR
ncbi:hypothetical protein KFE98_20500 [bacterium SCSIO 12741]|nr:hypothetical protein KFE98_20500 [bacterium SCSIO 12741]